MRISTILNEGTIKVPKETLKDVMNAVCSDIFSRAFTYLSNPKVQDNYPELEGLYAKLRKEFEKEFGKFSVYPEHGEDAVMHMPVYMRMAEVDPRYFKRNPNAKNRQYRIDVYSHIGDSREFGGTFTASSPGKAARLDIYLPKQPDFERIVRAPEMLDGMIERITGYAEHELMHGIQNMALKQDDSEVAQYYDSDNNLIDDKYYTSEIEFSPQIVSAAKDFIAEIRELRALGMSVTPEHVKKLMNRFVNPTAPELAGIETVRSRFFEVLYKKNTKKWKKAVKYFYGLVQNKI